MATKYTTGRRAGQYVYTQQYCSQKATQAYTDCVLSNQIASGGAKQGPYPSPPPLPIIQRPPTPVRNQPPPSKSPPPLGLKPPVSRPVTNKGPTSSPTPTDQTLYAKPDSPPPPHKDHKPSHDGHARA